MNLKKAKKKTEVQFLIVIKNRNAVKLKLRTKPKVYSTQYSQAVIHPSTNRSQPCLTSVIGRELVYSR